MCIEFEILQDDLELFILLTFNTIPKSKMSNVFLVVIQLHFLHLVFVFASVVFLQLNIID